MLNQILSYNAAGFATFPVNAKTKTPACKDWAGRTADVFAASLEEEEYTRAGAYGVVLRPQDLILDLDPRNFQDNINPWRKLKDDLGLEIEAPAVATGGGGVHLYFRKPAELNIISKLPAYPGLDFKAGALGKSAYVIGPGSGHPSGKAYAPLKGFDLDLITAAPEALLNLITRTEAPLTEGTGTLEGGPQELKRYETWLKTAPPAVEGEGGDLTTFKAAAQGRDFGLKPRDTLLAMLEHYNPRCVPSWSEDELKQKIRNAYNYAAGQAGKEDPKTAFTSVEPEGWDDEDDEERKYDLDAKQGPKKTLKNAINYLYISPELRGTARYNQFTGDIEMVGKLPWHKKRGQHLTWTDADVALLKYHLAKTKKIEFSVSLLWEALHVTSIRFSYHPVREYIKSCRWDGKERLNTWLSTYCGALDNPYTRAVGRKTLLGMVARVFEPGVKFDYCTILEGEQGIGKSTVCSILGGKWYGDIILDPHARDTIDAMRGKWVIELSEMEVTKRADAQALKAFISRTSDRARLAYARMALDFPRQCVFMGTINPDDMGYLTDPTGNRRFWPVKCGEKVDMRGLEQVRDQLFAEAYAGYKQGEELYLSGDIVKYAEMEQKARVTADSWQDVIADYLENEGKELEDISVPQLWTWALGGEARSLSRSDQCRIGRILKNLGWWKWRPLRGGSRVYMHKRPETAVIE